MRVEMISIGDELLDGRVADGNSGEVGRRLGEVGLHLAQVALVPDDLAAIVAAAAAAAARGTGVCVVSGGLGPTADDVTAEALAQLAGVPLARDPAEVDKIAAHARRRGRALTDNQLRQADRPAGARRIANPVGTASGFSLSFRGCEFVALPGVPHEFTHLLEAALVAPRRAQRPPVLRCSLSTFGLAESEVDARLGELPRRWPAVRLQFRTAFPCNHVSMHAPPAEADALAAAFACARLRLGAHVFTLAQQTLAEVVVEQLRAHRQTLALAESCTGGLLGDLLTDVPGSSAVLIAGLVAYAPAAKQALLAVDAALLAREGAVSLGCAQQMAEGARRAAGSDFALALTGIAGPGGGSPSRPVGRIYLAGVGPRGTAWSETLQLTYGRRQTKQVAAMTALDSLRRRLAPPAPPS